MLPRRAALIAILALGVGACGADDELSTDIPRTSPDLTIPTATTELPPAETTSTTSTTSTSTTASPDAQPGVTPAPAGAAPPPAVTPPAAPAPSSTTGGASPGGTGGQPATGGASPGDGEFENFCRDNPGAGPPC